MSRVKLPFMSELMATTGFRRNGKYRLYMLDPDFMGPTPGSNVLYSHYDAYNNLGAANIAEGAVSGWLPTADNYEPTNLKTVWRNAIPALGYETLPRTYGHRIRTVGDLGLKINDVVMIYMAPSVEVAVPPFVASKAYTAGNYARHRNTANANNGRIFRCLSNDTSTTAENNWSSSVSSWGFIKQPGGLLFVREAASSSYLDPAISMWPFRIVGFEGFSNSYIIDVSWNPDENGGGGQGWVFPCNKKYLSELGPENSYFAVSQPLSSGIPTDDGLADTCIRQYYNVTDARSLQYRGQRLRYRNNGGIRFTPMDNEAASAKFTVLVQVANRYDDEEEWPYEEQRLIYAWKNRRQVFTDADVEEDPTYGPTIRGPEELYIGVT